MSSQKSSGEPWQAGLCGDVETATTLLTSSLSSPEKALKSLGAVLLLLTKFPNFSQRSSANQLTKLNHLNRVGLEDEQTIPWSEKSVSEYSGSACDRFALAVIHDAICRCHAQFSLAGILTSFISIAATPLSEERVQVARSFLETILPSVNHLDFPRALYILRFSARHQPLRRFVDIKVVDALMLALDRITKSRNTDLYPLIMDSMRYLINDGTCCERRLLYMLILCR